MSDLNSLLVNGAGWNLAEGHGINDAGQITGFGTFNGQTRAFLLTPLTESPEPATYALLAIGLALALRKPAATRSPLPPPPESPQTPPTR